MDTNDTIFEFEGKQYVNPNTSLNEQLAFIDTLKDLQTQNTAEINQNTYNLGSHVPSNVGGLTGSEGLWTAQYQTPQTDVQIADLRATAQQAALNQALNNLQNMYQNKYKQASREYSRRARSGSGSNGGVGPLGNTPQNTQDPEIETIPTDLDAFQAGIGYEGWTYIPNPDGGDRWYKNLPNGEIDYENYVDKNPNTRQRYRNGVLIEGNGAAPFDSITNLSSKMRNAWTKIQNKDK